MSAARAKLDIRCTKALRPAEAVLMLEWAMACENEADRCALLDIFEQVGGVKLVQGAVGRVH